MFKVASWFRPRPSSEGRGVVDPVTPFIVALDLKADRAHPGAGVDPVLGARDFEPVLAALQPQLTQLFLRMPDACPLAMWSEWLPRLESLGLRYHLETRLPWLEPRPLLGRLHALERLDRLRIPMTGFEDWTNGPGASQLQMALDTGLNVWSILPLAAAGAGDLEARVARGQSMGLRGMSFKLPGQVEPGQEGECLRALSAVYARGYPVYLEGCLPVEAPPLVPAPDRIRHRREGICWVDGSAQVWTCPHAEAPLGSLRQASLESLWADGPPVETEATPAAPPPALHLDETLCPLAFCDIRTEAEGALLVHGYRFMPVTARGLDVVRAFDGQQTLHQLNKRFGKETATLALALFQRDMLRFVQPDDDHA